MRSVPFVCIYAKEQILFHRSEIGHLAWCLPNPCDGDWNCGSTQLSASRVGRAVADLDIMLEQPCATLEQCAAVRAASNLPMKIDECAHDTASLLKAHELGVLDAVALKQLAHVEEALKVCRYFVVSLHIFFDGDIADAGALVRFHHFRIDIIVLRSSIF